MNLKLILGIFIPLIFIIALIILSSINVGYSIEKENEKNLEYNKLFTSQSQAGEVKIQTITIKNDYFLPKKIELPKIMVCLSDKEGKTRNQNLYVRYNEGKSSEIPKTPIVEDLGLARSSYGYNYYTTTKAVEVPAHSTKEVKVMVQPKYSYNYNYPTQNYADYEYDELLIIEPDDDNNYAYYDSCTKLDDKDIDAATHIEIVEKPSVQFNQVGVSSSSRDIKDCDRLFGANKDSCIRDIAVNSGNLKSCDFMFNENFKYTCYSDLAVKQRNISICYKIPETAISSAGNTRDYCVALTAVNLNDATICNNIKEGGAKNYCLQMIV